MSRLFKDLEVGLDEELSEKIAWMMPEHGEYRVLRQSVDARQRHRTHFVYSVEVAEKGEALPVQNFPVEPIKYTPSMKMPLIVGSGPAGLFAALRLVERGVPCHMFERGSESGERMKGINKYWRHGDLDPNNNVCLGEGGAGLYSDGKLITRIKSPHIPYVLERLVRFGAPEEIMYLANPHVGSDRIRRVIPKVRAFLLAHGCQIHFDTKIEKILFKNNKAVGVVTSKGETFESDHVCVATGHSAEDMLTHLRDEGVALEGKSFAMGLRIEHPQGMINKLQYRDAHEHPKLGSANYKLAHHDKKSDIGVYSFCMCPGGYVLSAGTEAQGLVCNGMSNYRRNSLFANAAIVVSVQHDKKFGQNLFGGLSFRQELEQKALESVKSAGGTKELPAQRATDFLAGRLGTVREGSSPSGAIATNLAGLLPTDMRSRLIEGLEIFNKKMPGFISEDAQLYGVESRTSCPVRVVRHTETLESTSHAGLYPCGEGAGYAGGITSAACDGIRVAEKICESLVGHAIEPVETATSI